MKKIIPLVIAAAGISLFISCGNAETKADASNTIEKKSEDTSTSIKPQKLTEAKLLVRDSQSTNTKDKNNILRNIDQHLVSKLVYPNPGVLTVENKLTGITIQKALIEVTIMKDNGDPVRTDYYIVENIEPGGSKALKITTAAKGTKASSHVVKLKSNELTNGEMILVGSKYVSE